MVVLKQGRIGLAASSDDFMELKVLCITHSQGSAENSKRLPCRPTSTAPARLDHRCPERPWLPPAPSAVLPVSRRRSLPWLQITALQVDWMMRVDSRCSAALASRRGSRLVSAKAEESRERKSWRSCTCSEHRPSCTGQCTSLLHRKALADCHLSSLPILNEWIPTSHICS